LQNLSCNRWLMLALWKFQIIKELWRNDLSALKFFAPEMTHGPSLLCNGQVLVTWESCADKLLSFVRVYACFFLYPIFI
jgi:hypothetical protein